MSKNVYIHTFRNSLTMSSFKDKDLFDSRNRRYCGRKRFFLFMTLVKKNKNKSVKCLICLRNELFFLGDPLFI